MYTIGIKRKFWFGFRKFRVHGHTTEVLIKVTGPGDRQIEKEIKPRLVLRLEDETRLLIPGIEEKAWKIYPDFFVKDGQWQESAAKNPPSMVPLPT